MASKGILLGVLVGAVLVVVALLVLAFLWGTPPGDGIRGVRVENSKYTCSGLGSISFTFDLVNNATTGNTSQVRMRVWDTNATGINEYLNETRSYYVAAQATTHVQENFAVAQTCPPSSAKWDVRLV